MPPPSERHEARRKKKNFYAALKKQEDNKLQELADKYRDRARERRDNANPDYQAMDVAGGASNAYRAVAPDLKSGYDAAERRKQMIQESKFLGGDMEHTHLVKGLDYALLQKVRSEIVVKEHEQEAEMEKLAEAEVEEKEKEEEKNLAEEPEYRSIMGRNIHNIVTFYRSRHVERNELFAPGRMAYVIELEDENAETDIPTTSIRSKADVPVTHADIQTLTTNDIVINKLAQILSYLRQGRGKKNKRRDKDKPLIKEPEREKDTRGDRDRDRDRERDRGRNRDRYDRQDRSRREKDVSIYDDLGDYRPSRRAGDNSYDNPSKPSSSGESSRRNRNYFDKSSEQEEKEAGAITRKIIQIVRRHRNCNFPFVFIAVPPPPKISTNLISKLTAEPEGYAECYPGLQEMDDAIDDSDDEVDYTKMDLGNKKGPIGEYLKMYQVRLFIHQTFSYVRSLGFRHSRRIFRLHEYQGSSTESRVPIRC